MDREEVARLVQSVEEIATGYIPAAILFAAIELRLFDALEVPSSLETLSTKIGATPNALERLCRSLATMGLVVIESDNVRATDAARAVLGSEGGSSRAAILRHHHRHLAPPLFRLADAVRSGHPQHAAWPFAANPPHSIPYAELARHPEEYDAFLSAMDASSEGVGRAIVAKVDLSRVERLVDLGCGGGQVARELLEAFPMLRVEGFDVAPACDVARARSDARGLSSRHTLRVGDLFESSAPPADAVLLSAILADWPENERARILANAARSLKPGGLLLVSETLFDDDKRGPPKVALLSLFLLAALRGDQLSESELRHELALAGFTSVEVHRMAPRDLAIARKSPKAV